MQSQGWVPLRGGESCSAPSLFVQQMIPLSPVAICVFPEVFYSRNGGEVLTATGFLPQASKTTEIWIYLMEKMALILFPWEIEDKELFLMLSIDWTKNSDIFHKMFHSLKLPHFWDKIISRQLQLHRWISGRGIRSSSLLILSPFLQMSQFLY